jgi:hypothetical protein
MGKKVKQHAAAPVLHGLKVFLPQINISNKRGPTPQWNFHHDCLSPNFSEEWSMKSEETFVKFEEPSIKFENLRRGPWNWRRHL